MILFCLLSLFLADISAAIPQNIPVQGLSSQDGIYRLKARAMSIPPMIIATTPKERRSILPFSTAEYLGATSLSRRSTGTKTLSSREAGHRSNLLRRGACISKACGNKSKSPRSPVISHTSSQSAIRGSPIAPISETPSTGSPTDKFNEHALLAPDQRHPPPLDMSNRSRRPSSAETVHPGGPQRPASADSALSNRPRVIDRPSSAESIAPGGRPAITRLVSAESIVPRGRQTSSRPMSAESIFPKESEQTSSHGGSAPPPSPQSPTETDITTPGRSSIASSRIESFYPHRGGERRVKLTGSPRSSASGSPRSTIDGARSTELAN